MESLLSHDVNFKCDQKYAAVSNTSNLSIFLLENKERSDI
jgi:hypothetical protein